MVQDAEEETSRRLVETAGRPNPAHHYNDGPHRIFEEYGSRSDPDVVLLHGGAWRPDINRGGTRPAALALAESGLHVYLPEYRRTPGHPMQSLGDIEDFLGYLAGHGDDVRVLIGHSAGGHLTLLHAAAYKAHSPHVVALAPVADLFLYAKESPTGAADVQAWLGASAKERPALWHRLNPAEHLDPEPAGVTILHGDADQTVPLHVTAGFTRTVVPGAHHLDLIDPQSEHFTAVLGAVHAAL